MPRTWKTPGLSPATATSTHLGTHFSYKKPSSSSKTDFIHTELPEGPRVSEENGQCIHYAEEEKQPQKVEETEKDLNQSQGELWEASGVSSVLNPCFISMPLMSNVRYQFDHLLICRYAKLLRLTEADSEGWAGGVDSDRMEGTSHPARSQRLKWALTA